MGDPGPGLSPVMGALVRRPLGRFGKITGIRRQPSEHAVRFFEFYSGFAVFSRVFLTFSAHRFAPKEGPKDPIS